MHSLPATENRKNSASYPQEVLAPRFAVDVRDAPRLNASAHPSTLQIDGPLTHKFQWNEKSILQNRAKRRMISVG